MRLLLLFITLVSFILRIYQTGNYPPLLWDEAALGYNAFSLLNTGKDEYGQFLPLIFKSFGDFKPGLLVYLVIPFVKIFGLTELSVRLPSIILGSLTPLAFYFLIKKINPSLKIVGLLGAIIICFQPYNIHFSRQAWETNILTFELVFGLYLLYSRKIFFAAVIFGLSFYTYQAAKIITPAVLFFYFITARPNLKPFIIKFIFPLLILALPLVYNLLTTPSVNRLATVAQFDISSFLTRYFNHFSPRFLIFEGDWQINRNSAPYIGVILYPSLIFLVIGLISSFLRPQKYHWFFLSWLLFSPVPSALTKDLIQPVRIMSFSVPLTFFISSGLVFVFSRFRSRFLIGLTVLFYFFSFIYYLDLYFFHLVAKNPEYSLYGYQSAITYLLSHQTSKSQVYFSPYYGQPYIYYLFYSHYPPANFHPQAELITTSHDVGSISSIDNIHFSTPDYQYLRFQKNTLSIFSQADIYKQGINLMPNFKTDFIPLSPINGFSTFYAYQN